MNNTYWPTGELHKVSVSRVYPVEYTDDTSGRMATMTTWRGAASSTEEAVAKRLYRFLAKRFFHPLSPRGPLDFGGHSL